MKEYPLELENWGGDVYTLVSRGHHPFEEFIAAMRKEYPDWPMGKPEHLYMKAVPDPTGNYICRYFPAEKGQRGAFPVTYSSEDYGNPVNLKEAP